MSGLAKATLVALDGAARPSAVGEPEPVQFNPASLRLQLTNGNDGSPSPARQRQQHTGSGQSTISFDLHFDTCDEGSTDAPVNVRDRTALVRRFLLPAEGSSQPPPKVRFQWGTFIFDGIVTTCTEELDFFSDGGVPLRAKCTVSIKEQDPKFAANQRGPGTADTSSAAPPGEAPGGPGTAGSGGDQSAPALEGESLPEFAARMGLDPEAWRAMAGGLGDTLALAGGLEIDFSVGLSASAGIGFALGVEAGVDVSLEAGFGIETPPAAAASRSPSLDAGFALAKAGGVTAAIEQVAAAKAQTAAARTVAAFAQPGGAPAATSRPSAPQQPRGSLGKAGSLPSPAAQAAAPTAPDPPRADARATSFGFGVPLRPRPQRVSASGPAPATTDPTTPGWVALGAIRRAALAQGKRPCGCGCGGAH